MGISKIFHAPQYGVRRQPKKEQAPIQDTTQPDGDIQEIKQNIVKSCGGAETSMAAGTGGSGFHYPRDLALPEDPVPECRVPSKPQVKIEVRKSRKIPTQTPSLA
ncbi:hypothetical protein HMI48_11005 [Acidithiobacillus ferrooxidans]|uniref:Uncharacterized protein n=2 Tax=Acidithiobacillus ferrooxidans TaxID=920 RepID=A0A2W1KLI2_ACIFR|nr:hypothetical protein [Acidithiobacillus ferrooxidans]MBU2774377.1 hypothetical protein [Acidithiobacillus ferrooxidans]PZD80211.1 hypothetical protein DN052_13755 [Acidithiobacillus ferrooxidans]BDB14866.1 hypothetical protein ANFP_21860 [Acidithiobacillus ferrooxidans]